MALNILPYPTQDLRPDDTVNFEALFTPKFNRWINDVIDARVSAALDDRLESEMSREVSEQLENKVEMECETFLENQDLANFFSMDDAVTDVLDSGVLDDYVDVEETVERFLDRSSMLEERVANILKELLRKAVYTLEEE